MTTERFVRAMGFSEQEITDELARVGRQPSCRSSVGRMESGNRSGTICFEERGAHAEQADAQRSAAEGAESAASAGPTPGEHRSGTPGSEPALTLEGQDAEGLKAKTERETAATVADKAEQKRLADNAKADAERGEFTLTGSDRPANVAAAAGQGDILAAPTLAALPQQIKQIEARYGQAVRDSFNVEPAALTRDEVTYVLGFRDADPSELARLRQSKSEAIRLRAKGLRAKAAVLTNGNGESERVSPGGAPGALRDVDAGGAVLRGDDTGASGDLPRARVTALGIAADLESTGRASLVGRQDHSAADLAELARSSSRPSRGPHSLQTPTSWRSGIESRPSGSCQGCRAAAFRSR